MCYIEHPDRVAEQIEMHYNICKPTLKGRSWRVNLIYECVVKCMDRDFEQMYSSKSKFLQRYIDNILKHKGRGDFIRAILFRAWTMYYKYCFDYKIVRRHLDSKFTGYEMGLIKIEKESRAHKKACIRNSELKHDIAESLLTKKLAKLRVVEVFIARELGYTYRQISTELGIGTYAVSEAVRKQKRTLALEEIRYMKNTLDVIINYGNANGL